MAEGVVGRNLTFPIFNSDGTLFNDLVLHKATYDSVVMSLGDKITGDVYYRGTNLAVTMGEYVEYDGVKFVLVSPPVIVREGMVSDNSELRGLTKYSFTFYHPMYMLANFPFSDVAVSNDQKKYLSENKSFSWIGNLTDFVAKINKNLASTKWYCDISLDVQQSDREKLSEVMTFDNESIADAIKRGYETWKFPYIIDSIKSTDTRYSTQYAQGKRFLIQFGLPTRQITKNSSTFVFEYGQGVGLKNNSRTPRNNKIITRIAGYGSEDNIPYGYPQVQWYGNQDWDYTVNNSSSAANSYPIYDGIVGGQKVRLIKHPFTRTHLMPTIYATTLFNKISPYLANGSANPNYNPNLELEDYYDADGTYPNPIVSDSPSYEIREFEDIKPELQSRQISSVGTYDNKYLESVTMSDFLDLLEDFITQSQYDVEKTQLEDIKNGIETQDSDSGTVTPPITAVGSRLYSCKWSYYKDDYYAYVKYESNGQNFDYIVRLSSAMPVPDWDDTMDDEGNYVQSYFTLTLPALGFDLYACAAITQEMSINMRSGACLGCTFQVMVDWDDYKKNFYDDEGNFDPAIGTGHPRDAQKYPNSTSSAITVVVQKDLNTFGTLMPNIYQKPAANDDFVILGISLPQSYVTNAQTRLEQDMKQYMRDNNVHYYDYPLKFDEYFLAKNTDILQQMRTNVVVKFKYNDETLALYIKQMTVKFGDKPLPEYNITLTDDVEIVLNEIGRVSEEVSNIKLLMGEGGDMSFEKADKRYLRKDSDDTAAGLIRFTRGLQVGERFVTGLLGEGGIFRKDADGTTYLECDKMYVRMKAYFDTVEVRRYLHSGGNRIASAAGIKCSRVEWRTSNNAVTDNINNTVKFRCYFRASNDGVEITNDFEVNDLAWCKESNVNVGQGVEQRFYWRKVIAVSTAVNADGEHYIDLSKSDCQSGSDIPLAQDDIIQLGNTSDTSRQGAIIEYVTGEDAPSYQIYQGINSYSLNGKNYVRFGYDSSSHSAQAYIGNPDGSTYLWYHYVTEGGVTFPRLDLKANVEFTAPDGSTTTIEDFANLVTGDIEDIQSQIDGEIDTWFYEGQPTLNNMPAANWNTQALKEQHVGDLYYDIGVGLTAGFAYRFVRSQSEPYTYSWQYIDDTAITEALRIAAQAQDTADHKRRVFVSQPAPISPKTYVEYDVGDLWVNASGTYTYEEGGVTKTIVYDNDVLRCQAAKPVRDAQGEITDGTFNFADWKLASKYTDDSNLENFVNVTYAADQQNLQNQIDGKYETWFYNHRPTLNNLPASDWSAEEKAEHVGDLFWDDAHEHAYRFIVTDGVYSWEQIGDNGVICALADAAKAQDTADSKRRVFVTTPSNEYDVGDLWTNVSGTFTKRDGTTTVTYDDDILRAKFPVPRTPSGGSAITTFNIEDWEPASNYTSDAALEAFLNGYSGTLGDAIKEQVDKKAETWVMSSNPANAWTTTELKDQHVGDMWLNTSASEISNVGSMKTAAYRKYTSGGVTIYGWVVDNTIPNDVFDTIDRHSSIFLTQPTSYEERDLWILDGSYTLGSPAKTYLAGEVVSATATSSTFNSAHWTKKTRYTGDETVNTFITAYGSILGITATPEGVGQALGHINSVLKDGSTLVNGGLMMTNIIYMKDAAQNPSIWGGISGLYQTNETDSSTYKGHGVAAWYGGGVSNSIPVDKEMISGTPSESSWSTLRWARTLFRFDGSGYVADGNISWDKTGTLTIKGNVVDTTTLKIGGTTVNLNDYLPKSAGSGNALTGDLYAHSIVPSATNSYVLGSQALWWNRLFVNRIYLYKPNANNDTGAVYIEYNTTSGSEGVHLVGAGFYSDSYISALGNSGTSGGGGGATALSQLVDVSLSNPSAGQFLVYRNAHWTNESISSLSLTSLSAGSATISNALSANAITVGNTLTVTGAITSVMGGFNVSGKDNTYVLLAGGGTKLLSEIGGGSVNGIKIGTSATEYTPDANGIITLPAYPSSYVASISVNGGTPITPTSGVVGISGLATTVKVGSTSYAASSAGVVELPAYPTVTDTKNTAGSTALNATKLFIIGANSQAANPQTYSNVNCYIGTDNCIYSGGSKVLTGITSSDVTTALGYTPPATSDLNNYLPTSGGTLTNSAYGGQLTIKRSTSGGQAVIRFENNSGFLGSIGVTGAGIPVFGDGTQDNVILHSGNVGDYGFLPLTGGTMTGAIKWPSNHRGVTNGWNIYTNNYGIEVLNAANVADAGAPSHYATALHVSGSYWFQLSFARGGLDDFLIRGGNNTGVIVSWQHLLHTGNYTNYVLPITGGNMSGNLTFNNGKGVLIKDTNGNDISAVYLTTGNRLYFGYGLATRTYQTRIYGTPLLFYTYNGTNSIEAMRVASNGSVGIGGVGSPSEALEVNGNIKATHVYNGDGNEYLTSASLSGYVQAIVVNNEQPVGASSGVITLSGIVKSISLTSGGTSLTPSTSGVITMPAASASEYGVVKVNSVYGQAVTLAASGQGSTRNYGLQLDSNGKAFVYVPWDNSITSSDVTTALGFTPAASSDLANYLPKSGGTISSTGYGTQLTIKRNQNNANAVIRYENANQGFLGEIGVTGSADTLGANVLYFGDPNSKYTIIHSGNVGTMGYLPLAGGEMSGRIKWPTNSGNVANGWNIFTADAGICIFNSNINGTGSKVRYSTALHVGGQYWFQLGHMRTTYDSLFYRAGTVNGVTKDWCAFVFATGTSSQFIKGDGSLDSNTYLTSGDVVTVGTTQNVTGSKTFTSKLTASAGCSFTGGLKAYSLCIESASDGTPSSARYGEINRYNNNALHLQYDTNTGGITMCKGGGNVAVGTDSISTLYKFKVMGRSNFSDQMGIATDVDTTDGNTKLFIGGTGKALAWNTTSDMRMKEVTGYIDDLTVDAIAMAPVFRFKWKDYQMAGEYDGTSAQYWQSVLPKSVNIGGDGMLSLDYSTTALIASVITARKVVDHERRIQELERENEYLREQIEDLKAAA